MKKIIALLLAGATMMSCTTMAMAEATLDTPILNGTIGDGWVVKAENGVTADVAGFSLSDDNAYSLPYSLKLSHPVKADSATDINYRIGITLPVQLTQGSKYKISFKSTEPMRNSTINTNMYFGKQLGWHSGWKQYSSVTADTVVQKLGDSGWYQNTFYYTAGASNILLGLNTHCNAFEARYFDDFEISLVTTDAEGKEILTPLELKDPSFDATAPKEEDSEEVEVSGEEKTTFGNWDSNIVPPASDRKAVVEHSADEKVSGNYSAHIIYEGANVGYTWTKFYYTNLLDGTTNALADTYKINFKLKGTAKQLFVGFGAAWGKTTKLHSYLNGSTDPNVVVEDLGNGWKDITIIRSDNNDRTLLFHADANADIYLDDVTVYNVTDSAAVTVGNNSFEAFYTDNMYDLNNPVANSGNGQIVISWYNPTFIDLTDVQVLENGTELTTSAEKEDWVLTKGGYNRLILTGATEGAHTYTIRAYKNETTYTDYTVQTILATGRFTGGSLVDGNYAENWAIQYSSGTGTFPETALYLDDEIKYSGNYALRAQINEQVNASNTYVLLNKSFPTEEGKTYRISYMGRSAGVGADTACMFYDTAVSAKPWTGTKVTKGTTDWKCYTRDYTATGTTAEVYFMLQGAARSRSIWIDDVKVQEVLEDGSLGDNVLNGGGFEKEVTNLTEANNVLSWNKDGLFYNYVNIYEKKADGTLEKVNVTEKVTGTSYLLKDSISEEKTYVVKAVLVKGNAEIESEGVEITVDGKYSVTEDEAFEQVTFESDFSSVGEGAEVIKSLDKIENGNIMASMTIANKNGDWSLPVKYIMALYNSGKLEDVVLVEKTIGWRQSETLSAVVNVADVNAGEYEIKTFLWDNNMNAYKEAGVLGE